MSEGAPHVQEAVLEIHIVPLEDQELTLTHPGVEGEHVERLEFVPAHCLEEAAIHCKKRVFESLIRAPKAH
jgi:hypothetical protein